MQQDEEEPSIKKTPDLSLCLSHNPNLPSFLLSSPHAYPNRLICHLKIKVLSQHKVTVNGSCVLIEEGYALTAAHNLAWQEQKKQQLEERGQEYRDGVVIRQGLREGECLAEYEIEKQLWPDKYRTGAASGDRRMFDFALLKVRLMNPVDKLPQEEYPPLLALTEDEAKNITTIEIFGYPLPINRKLSEEDNEHSSLYMRNAYGHAGPLKAVEEDMLHYKVPTQTGTSGAPIITQYRKSPAIIGIHTCKHRSKEEKEGYNMGIGCGRMMEEINEWGYRLRKKPFIFTGKTLKLRKSDPLLHKRDILQLSDQGIGPQDILVFTAYDLSNLKKIIVSGNRLGELGVEYLLRREYPYLQSLYLTQNQIGNLQHISERGWRNIQSVTCLGLGVNHLDGLPGQLLMLGQLERLWLNYNRLKEIPEVVVSLCRSHGSERRIIYLYENKFEGESDVNRQRRKAISEGRANVVWVKGYRSDAE